MHYLVTLWDGGGTVPAEIGVVRRLVQRGHTVTVLADPTVEADATSAGAEFRSWRRLRIAGRPQWSAPPAGSARASAPT